MGHAAVLPRGPAILRQDKHAVSAERVVNIDETSCRLLPVHQVGWGRRGVQQAQLQGNSKEPRRSRSPSAWTVTRWTCWCRLCAGKTDAVLPEQPWPPRHIGERLGHDDDAPAAHSHIGRRAQSRQGGTVVDPPLGHGQHPRQRGHPGCHEGRIHSHCAVFHPATKHFVLAALRRGRLPQLEELHPGASERHPCPLRPRRHLRKRGHEQSMAAPVFGRMGSSRSRREQGLDNWVASIACPQRCPLKRSRRRGRGTQAHDELFSRHIEPEPAPEDPVDWAMAEASDEEDDAPVPDAPPEPEIIDMPPAPRVRCWTKLIVN